MTLNSPPTIDDEARREALFAAREAAGWLQERADLALALDKQQAIVSLHAFEELDDYSCSLPSGVYEHKVWKRGYPFPKATHWQLGEYFDNGVPGRMGIRWRELVILEVRVVEELLRWIGVE